MNDNVRSACRHLSPLVRPGHFLLLAYNPWTAEYVYVNVEERVLDEAGHVTLKNFFDDLAVKKMTS